MLGIILGMVFVSCSLQRNPLNEIIESKLSKTNKAIALNPSHEVQILYTSIERDSLGQPHFTEWDFGLDESYYFYPASTAKLPIAILALQKLNLLRQKGHAINKDTPFRVTDFQHQLPVVIDSTLNSGFYSVSRLIKEIFLVSDNDAYNVLFDFLGTDAINRELQKRGLNNTEIHHKFLLGADNLNTWEYTFFEGQDTLYHQPSIHSNFDRNHKNLRGVYKGKGYLENGKRVTASMDFSRKNRISIRDLNGLIKRVIFPEVFPEDQRFVLSEEDLTFLRFWMSRTTLESPYYKHTNSQEYWDSYNKFFIYGDTKGAMTDALRIYNKVGAAYGTLTDVAYIKEKNSGIEFMLTATVLVNKNEIFNDDQYEYDSVGIPFLAALGSVVYDLEKQKK